MKKSTFSEELGVRFRRPGRFSIQQTTSDVGGVARRECPMTFRAAASLLAVFLAAYSSWLAQRSAQLYLRIFQADGNRVRTAPVPLKAGWCARSEPGWPR